MNGRQSFEHPVRAGFFKELDAILPLPRRGGRAGVRGQLGGGVMMLTETSFFVGYERCSPDKLALAASMNDTRMFQVTNLNANAVSLRDMASCPRK